ncbi:hypothetical protein QN277_001869 [Acacia crassicarpa]|nr:hypothetical protein QN277_001869 [Acacia crassicarpa]
MIPILLSFLHILKLGDESHATFEFCSFNVCLASLFGVPIEEEEAALRETIQEAGVGGIAGGKSTGTEAR